MRSDEGSARHAHARNTLEERWARWACVGGTLGVGSRCARAQSTNTQRMPSMCSACAPSVSGVGPVHVWRPAGVYIHASSSAHIYVYMRKNPDARIERLRVHCVGPARSTHDRSVCMVTHTQ